MVTMNQLHGTDLKRFVRDWRRAHPPQTEIVLVLQSVTYPANVGSIFRIADALHVDEVVLCSATPTPDSQKITKVARDKQRKVTWRYVERTETALGDLAERGYLNLALEITDTAVPYFEFVYPEKVSLVLGNEDHGISRSVLEHCSGSIFIPMYGTGLSMNVHVSAAVAISHIRTQEATHT